MKRMCFLVACAFSILLFTGSASAGCWKCSTLTGCCIEQATGSYGRSVCSAIQVCMGGCACSNCQPSGNLCQGTGAAECNNPNGICEEHNTRLEEAPHVVPNGDSIDLLWLIRPPVSPALDAMPQAGSGGCVAVG